jgi:hypothetical protein
MDNETAQKLIEQVSDERSFLRFLKALHEDYEATERNCPGANRGHICVAEGHWESRSIRDFLRSAEDWGTGGDFGEGRHYGDPILRRVATMLYVGRYKPREESRDDDRD